MEAEAKRTGFDSSIKRLLREDNKLELGKKLLELFGIDKADKWEGVFLGTSKVIEVKTEEKDSRKEHYVFAKIGDTNSLENTIHIEKQDDETKAWLYKNSKIEELPKKAFYISTHKGQIAVLVEYYDDKFAYFDIPMKTGAKYDEDEPSEYSELQYIKLDTFLKLSSETEQELQKVFRKEFLNSNDPEEVALKKAAIEVAEQLSKYIKEQSLYVFYTGLDIRDQHVEYVDENGNGYEKHEIEKVPFLLMNLSNKSIIPISQDRRIENIASKVVSMEKPEPAISLPLFSETHKSYFPRIM